MDIVANIPKENDNENQTQLQLLNFIKDKLTDDEQLLFAESFHLYLQYNSEKDFVIDLNDMWKWVGFTQRVNFVKNYLSKILKKTKIIKSIIILLRKSLLCQQQKQTFVRVHP